MPFGSLQDHLKARARVLGFPSEPFAFLVTFWMGVENGYNGFTHQTYKYAEKINCPVLMEWGDKDIYVTQGEIERIYKNLKTANKKLVVYTGANHEAFLQSQKGSDSRLYSQSMILKAKGNIITICVPLLYLIKYKSQYQ